MTKLHDDGVYYELNNEEEYNLSSPSPKPLPQATRKIEEEYVCSVYSYVAIYAVTSGAGHLSKLCKVLCLLNLRGTYIRVVAK